MNEPRFHCCVDIGPTPGVWLRAKDDKAAAEEYRQRFNLPKTAEVRVTPDPDNKPDASSGKR